MLDDEDRRRSLLAAHGGPETLLHGDLWRKNVLLVRSTDGQVRPRLIDWDHAAVGQVAYDLSTLLSRFPRPERPAILALYRARVASAGWRLPDEGILNELFDTAERSRIANRVIWPAIHVRYGSHVEWALEQLVEVRSWFDRMEPVLP
jgi:thiamine kinase-like enzyme